MKNFANSRVWTAMLFILILLVAPLGVPANLQAADLTNGLPASLPVGNEDVVRAALYQAITGPVKIQFSATDNTTREYFFPPVDPSFTYDPKMGPLEDVIISNVWAGAQTLVGMKKFAGREFGVGVESRHDNWDLFNHFHKFTVPDSVDQLDDQLKSYPIDIFMYYIPVYAPAVKYVEIQWAPETGIANIEGGTNGAPSTCSLASLVGNGYIYLHCHTIIDFAGEVRLYTDDAHTQYVSYNYSYTGPHLSIGKTVSGARLTVTQTVGREGSVEVSDKFSGDAWETLFPFDTTMSRPLHFTDVSGKTRFYRLRITENLH